MTQLRTIKLVHTIIWALVAGCILAVPVAGLAHRFRLGALLSLIVLIECGILALNRGRCPLTGLAARYTADRSSNFDIYLPRWLARHNKAIFGTLFVISEVVLFWCWIS